MDNETLLLLSTDESERIPFPEGAYCEIASFLQALCRRRQPGHALRSCGGGAVLSFLVGMWFILAAPLQARLGESPERLEARYGSPAKFLNGICTRDFQCTYHHNGMTIVVNFLDEKSQSERYSNDDGAPLKPEEIQTLMGLNGRGGKWNLKEGPQDSKKWNLSSGDAVAMQDDKSGHSLEIRSSWWQRFLDQQPSKTKGEISERLKDF
ncbi:hypothetical protein CfE428DRAFT_3423 [Chthoniobacter flavus Ellin428]|uniref:Uncharacterized protein n=1 Tax=Chthoniobacter flavus Ellin428 TaxID=497964 RepID=B4D3D5_9BACT|nr:hypothetical protein [Chthoniobacter flavus]EDY19246.1 hypothetical protein CfE428DRAFT_3423 [Chthoniobacter flavus Ellin428]TCO88089.1 hypothetical protein EV701_119133 [Chthoniobacter flavus]